MPRKPTPIETMTTEQMVTWQCKQIDRLVLTMAELARHIVQLKGYDPTIGQGLPFAGAPRAAQPVLPPAEKPIETLMSDYLTSSPGGDVQPA